jgi:arsenate reductase (thioredoxin)
MRTPTILFLCSGNTSRSQMAEAFARQYGGKEFEVLSAGLEPGEIHPMTRQVMAEADCDLQGQYSKSVKEYLGKVLVDYLFIVCDKAAENCPSIWPGSPKLERIVRTFDDPVSAEGSEADRLAVFRRVRDEIDAAVKEWMEEHR